MPTIDLSNARPTTNSTPTTATMSPASPIPTTPAPAWNDPWSDPWSNNGGQKMGDNQKRLTPQERVGMIENVYQEILGRKPDTRDINYYKYSTLSEEEIRKQLLTGNEHKQLLLDGRDYKKVKERALTAETRAKILEGQIKDQVEEFKQLTNLLKEKNRYIQELREQLNSALNKTTFNPNEFIEQKTLITPTTAKNTTIYTNQIVEKPAQPQTERSKTLREKLVKRIADYISSLV